MGQSRGRGTYYPSFGPLHVVEPIQESAIAPGGTATMAPTIDAQVSLKLSEPLFF
jgi:hypothetical protein